MHAITLWSIYKEASWHLGYLSKHFKDSILKYQSKSGEHKYFRQSIKVGLGKKT